MPLAFSCRCDIAAAALEWNVVKTGKIICWKLEGEKLFGENKRMTLFEPGLPFFKIT